MQVPHDATSLRLKSYVLHFMCIRLFSDSESTDSFVYFCFLFSTSFSVFLTNGLFVPIKLIVCCWLGYLGYEVEFLHSDILVISFTWLRYWKRKWFLEGYVFNLNALSYSWLNTLQNLTFNFCKIITKK